MAGPLFYNTDVGGELYRFCGDQWDNLLLCSFCRHHEWRERRFRPWALLPALDLNLGWVKRIGDYQYNPSDAIWTQRHTDNGSGLIANGSGSRIESQARGRRL